MTSPEPAWGWAGETRRRQPSPAPSVYGGSGGGFGSAAFWATLGALSASQRAAYFQQYQNDPAYQQWRQQAARDPETANRLAALGDQSATAPARAPTGGGSDFVWIVVFAAGAVFVLLWLGRRRAANRAAATGPPGLSGSATMRFRVGQTIPLDPTPFLLAGGATKVQPPPGAGMISVEAVGLLEDAGIRLHRLYLPGRAAFFQLHLDARGAPDECRYFSRLDEVQPADRAECGLPPAERRVL